MPRLGDILVLQGSISREILEAAAPKLLGRLGEGLSAHALIHPHCLAQALATQQSLRIISLEKNPCDATLFMPSRLPRYLAHRYLPHHRSTEALVIVTPDPSDTLCRVMEEYYGTKVQLAVISSRDFTTAICKLAATTLSRRASMALRRQYRTLVADKMLAYSQRRSMLTSAALFILLGILAPQQSWYALVLAVNLFYLATIAFRLQLFCFSRREWVAVERLQSAIRARAARTPDDQWPVYSVLVPLYREDLGVVSRLITRLAALDYPPEKLDIKLICEADDTDTIAAIEGSTPPSGMEIIRVPPSYPRTKPKACNVARTFIRGEYVVIFDAEDAPDAQQLRLAATLFSLMPKDVACLQAPLNYYNRDENLLTRLFSIEYSALFRVTLPALQRLNLPIPLSGTSNHIRVAALENVGGWDAFNVTEDADLGVRLSYFGYCTRLLPSLTLEESPITLSAWLKQRSRWIKGYIQTWLVYMRNPGELRKRLGTRGYYGFQFFVGAPALTFLIAPFFWAATLMTYLGMFSAHLPDAILALCAISFQAGLALQLLYAIAAVRREPGSSMLGAMLIYPFYWLLHSVACLRAIAQLIYAPHAWEKTTHGVSRVFSSVSGSK